MVVRALTTITSRVVATRWISLTDERMREFWDEAARRNAAWYVDTSIDFDDPNMDRFFATGRAIVQMAIEESPIPLPGRALAVDIGCGIGRLSAALSERFDHVVGIDVSSEMIDQARGLVRTSNVTFEHGDGASLDPVEVGSADMVLSFVVFQHIPRRSIVDAYIAEAGRVLKPGGLFVFQWNNIPGSSYWLARRAVLTELQRRGIRPEQFGRHDPAFLGCRIPGRQIERALDRSGFELRARHGAGTLWSWAWAERR